MHVGERFDVADQIADLPGLKLRASAALGDELAQLEHFIGGGRFEEADFLPLADRAVANADVGDRPAIFVVMRIEHHRLQRSFRIAGWGGDMLDDRLEQQIDPLARLAAARNDFGRIDAEDRFHFGEHFVRPGVLQIDFVEHGNDRQIVLHRGEGVGDGLGLDPLERIDQQHGPFAAGEAAGDFVMEIDVARRVDQVQLVLFPLVFVGHRDRAGFDRDPAGALQLHVV